MKTKTLCLVAVITALLNTTGCSGDDDSVKQAELEKQGTEMKEKSSTVQANDKSSMPKELVAEPVTQAEAIEDNAKGEMTMKGSIIYKDLEGGFYAFIAENGDKQSLAIVFNTSKESLAADIEALKNVKLIHTSNGNTGVPALGFQIYLID